jgi:hypothetical protein
MGRGIVRWGFPRAAGAVPYLMEFLVVAVVTVLVTRGLLAMTGYPQIGGRGLHIAHVLWGGLLLALGVMMLLSFVGPAIRPVGSFVAGVGFGLFIDEVGKFLTSDNDYFFRPAVAVMYVTIVALVLAVHWVHGRRPLSPPEIYIAALSTAAGGVATGLTADARDEALRRLASVEDLPGARYAAEMVRSLPDGKGERHDLTDLGAWLVARLRRMLGTRIAERATLLILLVQTFVTLLGVVAVALALALDAADLEAEDTVPALIGGASAVAAALCVLVGVTRLRRRQRLAALRWLQRAVLIDLLLTRVFELAISQFGAIPSVVLDLLLLGTLEIARRNALDEDRAARSPVAAAVGGSAAGSAALA